MVTEAVRTIRTVPLRLRGAGPFPERLEVRGEVVIYKKDFAAINERRESLGQKLLANPRNAAAGALRQLDVANTQQMPLRFWPTAWARPAGDRRPPVISSTNWRPGCVTTVF